MDRLRRKKQFFGNGVLRCVFSLLVAALLVVPAVGQAGAVPYADSGVTDSGAPPDPLALERLLDWLYADEGGEYTLTGNIDWNGTQIIADRPATIHMNGYGIRIPGRRSFITHAPITFSGGGSDTPMFTVEPGAGLLLGEDVRVEVTDGCAIYTKGSCAYEKGGDCYLATSFTEIVARGRGSVAIRSGGDADLAFLNLSVREGACGIEAAGDVSLAVSSLDARDGYGVQAKGKTVLDASSVTPETGISLPRSVEPHTLSKRTVFMEPGDMNALPKKVWLALEREGAEPIVLIRPAEYPNAGMLRTPGIYRIPVRPKQIPGENPPLVLPETALNLVVAAPDLIYLAELKPYLNGVYRLLFFPYAAADPIAVYQSVDFGQSWSGIPVRRGEIWLDPQKRQVYWLQADLAMADGTIVRSSILEVEVGPDAELLFNPKSGDRDDSHRDDPSTGLPAGDALESGRGTPAGAKGNGRAAKSRGNGLREPEKALAPAAPEEAAPAGTDSGESAPPEDSFSPANTPEAVRNTASAGSAGTCETETNSRNRQPDGRKRPGVPESGQAAAEPWPESGARALWVPALFLGAAVLSGGLYALFSGRVKKQ